MSKKFVSNSMPMYRNLVDIAGPQQGVRQSPGRGGEGGRGRFAPAHLLLQLLLLLVGQPLSQLLRHALQKSKRCIIIIVGTFITI